MIQKQSLPKWIVIWLVMSTLIVFWDVMFVLLRPESLPDGRLNFIWLPYARYLEIDKSYADMGNSFVIAQAIMSLFEILIGLIALYLNYLGKLTAAILFAFSSLLLTGTKTVLIFVLEIVSGLPYVGHNGLADLLFYYVLPNSLWIIIPFLGVFSLGRMLAIYNHTASS